MTTRLPDIVSVELDTIELGESTHIGTLRRIGGSSGVAVSFEYAESWVERRDAFVIDPSHGLYLGGQYPRSGIEIFPIFSDAAPDRWGRTLLERREAYAARSEARARRHLGEWEFLLGVSDISRMGALRFVDGERYLDDQAQSVPPFAGLRELEAAALELERPERGQRSGDAERLALLLAPGSSLGGARPKATFVAEDGSLWIAKFPSANDSRDMAACEWVLNELAAEAGIDVPEHRLLTLGSGNRTFAARRFDRVGDSRRLYASAMTMLGRADREASSYLDIALAIADYGPSGLIQRELGSLFRRVVFNVLTSHRDDHLRNHGFLHSSEGWILSPAFDLNPMPEMTEHQLSLDDAIHQGELGLVLETAPFYRLSDDEAAHTVDEVRAAIASWRSVAVRGRLGSAEVEALEAAFHYVS